MPKSLVHLGTIEPKFFGRYENCYVELEKNVKGDLFEKLIEVSPRRSLTSIAELLNIDIDQLRSCKTRTPIKLSVLKSLCKHLILKGYQKFSLYNLEKHVVFIKGSTNSNKINKPKFPFNFATPEGLRIISKLFHDGGINKDRQAFYSNQDKELIDEFCEDVKSIFGEVNLIVIKSKRSLKVNLPRLMGDILKTVGCHIGSKVIDNPSPPNWIKNLDKNLIKEFIRSAMDDESCVGNGSIILALSVDITNQLHKDKKNKLLHLTKRERTEFMKKYSKTSSDKLLPKILLFDKKLIEKLEIKTNECRIDECYTDKRRKRLMLCWVMTISSKENLLKFYTKIRFKLQYKNEKLINYLKGGVYKKTDLGVIS